MGDETKTGNGAGPEDLVKRSTATAGDTEGQMHNKWLAHEPEAEGSAVGGDDTEGQRLMPTATSDEPGVGPDDVRNKSL